MNIHYRSVLFSTIGLSLLSGAAYSGVNKCPEGATLSADQRRCSDGSIPWYESTAVESVKPSALVQPLNPAPKPSDESSAASNDQPATAANDLSYFFRGWALFVPGAAYQVPSGLSNYDKIIVSGGTGVLHKLQINSNGTFRWDRTRGQWKLTGEGLDGNPIVLLRAYEGKDWTVGTNDRDRGIYVGDGFTWFQAKE